MRAAMYYNNKDVRLEEMEKPKISKGELVVKVIASGICGSDVMEWYRIRKAPLVLGHEVSGEVEEVGEGISDYKKGDKVFVTHHVPCYSCHYCKSGKETVCETLRTTKFYPGGFSEFLRVPEINVKLGTRKLPKEMSFEEGTFIEPLGCVIRAQRVAGMKKHYSVLVLGSGVSGLLHIQLAKALGAEKVFATDITEFKLDAAKKFGADFVFDAKESIKEKILEKNDDKLVDLVVVCAGAKQAVEQALECVDMGGTILLFAPTAPDKMIGLPLNEMWCKGISLITSYAAAEQDIDEAIELIKSGKINVKDMVTHRFPLAETGEGFRQMAEGKDVIKVIIEPQK